MTIHGKKKKISFQVKVFKEKNIDFATHSYQALKISQIVYQVNVPNNISYNTLIKSNPHAALPQF